MPRDVGIHQDILELLWVGKAERLDALTRSAVRDGEGRHDGAGIHVANAIARVEGCRLAGAGVHGERLPRGGGGGGGVACVGGTPGEDFAAEWLDVRRVQVRPE